jgi:hypothetical protein
MTLVRLNLMTMDASDRADEVSSPLSAVLPAAPIGGMENQQASDGADFSDHLNLRSFCRAEQ